MNRRPPVSLWHLAALAFPAVLMACGTSTRSLRIVHTTDLHGFYERSPSKDPTVHRGGLRRLATLIETSQVEGHHVLVVDSGDMWSGTLLTDLNEGRVGVAAFNALGYGAAALGNHEFDYGPVGPGRTEGGDPFGALKARLKEAKFPILAANLIDRKTGKLPTWPGLGATTIVERGGFRVGIVGIITPDTPSITFPYVGRLLRFADPAPIVQAQAAALREQGADLVIVIAHDGGSCRDTSDPKDRSSCLPESPSFKLAMALEPGSVDAIFGGHTHGETAHWVNGVAVIQPGRYSSHAGLLDVRQDGNQRPELTIHPPRALLGKPAGKLAQKVGAVLQPSEAAVRQIRSEKLGARLGRPLTRHRQQASELGSYLCDVMLGVFNDRQICLLNSGGMRNDLPAGEVTYGSLYDALPFGNHVAFVDLPGEVLKELLRVGTSGAHGVFQVAGVDIEYDLSKDPCPNVDRNKDGKIDTHDRDRLTLVRLADGSEIAPDKEYRVIMNSFMASGGDGLGASLKGVHASRIRILYDRLPVREQLAKYWREHKPVVNTADKPAMPRRRVRALGSEPLKACRKN